MKALASTDDPALAAWLGSLRLCGRAGHTAVTHFVTAV
jgi:hypothetical protein